MKDGYDGFSIDVDTAGMALAPRERAELDRFFWFTLGKFEPHLQRVEVRLTRADGVHRGSARCRVTVFLRTGAVTVVEGIDRDPTACVKRTFQRAERGIRRRAIPMRRHDLSSRLRTAG